ncbi:hypothetical protein K435DRAFT_965494 [Dendrothele bispora CBS 962.96]|uniref:Uncharacterized protein n=1 Tax=Dendrothele bispora (strain CBS 962.96) TaxID=1314807 RepID=A0A4S8M5X2_DENBC|nr:hypothetical protein K435DRAFT_965494 [Dendrothele bispora CBS 962.96]
MSSISTNNHPSKQPQSSRKHYQGPSTDAPSNQSNIASTYSAVLTLLCSSQTKGSHMSASTSSVSSFTSVSFWIWKMKSSGDDDRGSTTILENGSHPENSDSVSASSTLSASWRTSTRHNIITWEEMCGENDGSDGLRRYNSK